MNGLLRAGMAPSSSIETNGTGRLEESKKRIAGCVQPSVPQVQRALGIVRVRLRLCPAPVAPGGGQDLHGSAALGHFPPRQSGIDVVDHRRQLGNGVDLVVWPRTLEQLPDTLAFLRQLFRR